MAPQWWWTADPHFDHKAMIKYCKRPFSCTEEMDEIIIQRINSLVRPQDVLIIAGDIALHGTKECIEKNYLSRLNGNKIIIKGNHDHWIKSDKRYIYHKNINGQFTATCHYPFASWNRKNYGAWHLHGHSHCEGELTYNRLDVGVDGHNFYPWNFDEIKTYMENQGK